MEQTLREALAALGAEFLKHSEWAAATLWMRAAGDARFIERIENGGGFTVKTYDKVAGWFSRNWPEAAAWPEGVARPEFAEAEPAPPS